MYVTKLSCYDCGVMFEAKIAEDEDYEVVIGVEAEANEWGVHQNVYASDECDYYDGSIPDVCLCPTCSSDEHLCD